jgi:hypothetical protein
MYDSIAPLVREHLACAGPGAKVAFAGHSLGGSLATVLTLLMVHRWAARVAGRVGHAAALAQVCSAHAGLYALQGLPRSARRRGSGPAPRSLNALCSPPSPHPCRGDLPPDALASVHTFGAPAVFCESSGHHACRDAACPCGGATASAAAAAAASSPHIGALLPALGLGPGAITNVVMHRDIVPRAFVCDYSPVAEVLKSWLPSFKGHTGLASCKNHKVRAGEARRLGLGARGLGRAGLGSSRLGPCVDSAAQQPVSRSPRQPVAVCCHGPRAPSATDRSPLKQPALPPPRSCTTSSAR